MKIDQLFLAAMSMTAAVAGCSVDDDASSRDRRRDDEISRPRDRDVPRGAVVVREATTETVKHEPAHPGRVYLYDVDEDYVTYETRLRPGDRLVIDPEKDLIKINGEKDGKINLRSKHRYRLYYLRDDKARDGGKDRDRF